MTDERQMVFRILVYSSDREAESVLRHSLIERVALAELPADVITEKGVITEPVDLILGLSAADVDRAVRLLPEGATVAFTLGEFADALAISDAEAIDPHWLVTDVRPFPSGAPPTVEALRDIVARAHRLSNADDRASTRTDEIDARVDSIITALCA
ncbi:hypothetical protein SAMN04489806_2190 [Paramicrobacterium humi]|uniref:Uncharacterized protein n=1 Tax=Paramicrobacterium humi TaxID=640635 RepID=A0A1H4NHP5_9MICO|nr:hypothetical protein [Microbacterium humi]SEB94395.1 hypothetical protein SAMN04489806_2190 [Microbacterium humi]